MILFFFFFSQIIIFLQYLVFFFCSSRWNGFNTIRQYVYLFKWTIWYLFLIIVCLMPVSVHQLSDIGILELAVHFRFHHFLYYSSNLKNFMHSWTEKRKTNDCLPSSLPPFPSSSFYKATMTYCKLQISKQSKKTQFVKLWSCEIVNVFKKACNGWKVKKRTNFFKKCRSRFSERRLWVGAW